MGLPLVSRAQQLPPPQTAPTNLSTKTTPTNLSAKTMPTNLTMKVFPQQVNTKPLPTNLSLKPQDCRSNVATTNTVALHMAPSPAALASRGGSPVLAHQHVMSVNNNKIGGALTVPCSPRSTSPPIRVPNYAAHRPSILPVSFDNKNIVRDILGLHRCTMCASW